MFRLLLLVFVLVPLRLNAESEKPDFTDFQQWLVRTAKEAETRGISRQIINLAFTGLEPDPRVISFDRKQPEFVQTFDGYLVARITEFRINKAREYYQQEITLLSAVANQYKVDAQYLLAFWGLESSFGRYQGKYPIIRSLATLGFDARRSAFFTEELFNALQILEEGHITAEKFVGGWAGAMGQNQFLPSSFLNYAVDFDGDGKKNIWSNHADVWASIANYLNKNGWRKGAGWGSRVVLPMNLDLASLPYSIPEKSCRALRHHTEKLSLADWKTFGILPDKPITDSQPYALIMPGEGEKTSYLVGGNFRTILNYNCANKYAVSVGLLAEQIAPS